MTKFSKDKVLLLHQYIASETGGSVGLRDEGLKLLLEAKKATGLPIVTEIMNAAHIDMFADVDVIQVGARNMQNFEMLKELGIRLDFAAHAAV